MQQQNMPTFVRVFLEVDTAITTADAGMEDLLDEIWNKFFLQIEVKISSQQTNLVSSFRLQSII